MSSARGHLENTAIDLDFEPEDGMQVVVIASLRVYTRGGYYQLDVHKAQQAGLGALFMAYEKLKNKLEAEGLFDPARKRPLPAHVSRLGVITSKHGAAIKDIAKVAFSRSPRVNIFLIDVPVQGDAAAGAIAQAIADMNAYGKVDCMIVAGEAGRSKTCGRLTKKSWPAPFLNPRSPLFPRSAMRLILPLPISLPMFGQPRRRRRRKWP